MADRRLAWALVAVIVRYLTTIQPHAHRELARWRRRALAIPDPDLRVHVLRPYDADASAAGAALFAVLAPWRRQPQLVRLLVAYVLLWSYVDVRTERDPRVDPRLYAALTTALPHALAQGPPWAPDDDGGYLAALLAGCRRGCLMLPSWKSIAPTAHRLAQDGCVVQAINHGPAATAESRLRAWAQQRTDRPWHEACAAASSPLGIHALMALAAHRDASPHDIRATGSAYRLVSALALLCDHLIDDAEDHSRGNHTYLCYLGSPSALRDLAHRTALGALMLRRGARHSVILAAMTAMFLSRPQAPHPDARAILRAVGPPAPQLAGVLRFARRAKQWTAA